MGKATLREFAADTNNIKLLFDHFRNVGICGAIWAAAFWTWRQVPETPGGFATGVVYVSSAALGALASGLMFLNELHGIHRIRPILPAGWLGRVIELAYRLAVVYLLLAVARR